jgi:hypothetical protein
MRFSGDIACLAVIVSLGGSVARDREQPQFRSGVQVVAIDAYPSRNGHFVTGLTREDFEIVEDGILQSIESAELIRFPREASTSPSSSPSDPHYRVFVVYLDTVHIAATRMASVIRELADGLAQVSGKRDLVALINPGVTDLTFDSGIAAVRSRLKSATVTQLDDADERRITRCFPAEIAKAVLDLHRWDRQLRDIEWIVARLAEVRDVRSHLVLVSEGIERSHPATRVFDARTLRPVPNQTGTDVMGSERADTSDESRACLLELARVSDIDFAQRWRALQASANRVGCWSIRSIHAPFLPQSAARSPRTTCGCSRDRRAGAQRKVASQVHWSSSPATGAGSTCCATSARTRHETARSGRSRLPCAIGLSRPQQRTNTSRRSTPRLRRTTAHP